MTKDIITAALFISISAASAIGNVSGSSSDATPPASGYTIFLKENWVWIGPIVGGLLTTLFKLLFDSITTYKEKRNLRNTALKSIADDIEGCFDELKKKRVGKDTTRKMCDLKSSVESELKSLEALLLKVDPYSLPKLKKCLEDAKRVCNYLKSAEAGTDHEKLLFMDLFFNDPMEAWKENSIAKSLIDLQGFRDAFK